MVTQHPAPVCLDGTPFPVAWPEPGDAARLWRWNGDHFPVPLKPLTVACMTAPGTMAAQRRPFTEAGLPFPIAQRYLNGFQYISADAPSPDEQAALEAAALGLLAAQGGALGLWEEYCLPRIRPLLAGIPADGGTRPLTDLAEMAAEALMLTQVAGFSVRYVVAPLIRVCTEAFGAEGEALAFELTHGGENLTRAADQALWDLAELAGREAAVRRALLDGDGATVAALRALPEAAGLVAALDEYLETFGARAERWGFDSPTLRERPDAVLAVVRRTLLDDRPSPRALAGTATDRRASLIAALRGRLADRPAMLARFDEALAAVAPYVTIREDRAYWQLVASGAMRTALLARGRRLAEAGVLGDAEEIYFLLPDEVARIEAAGVMSGELAEAIGARRREWAEWAGRTPPAMLGPQGTPPGHATASAAGAPEHGRVTLRGVAASRGVVTARACVVADLDDADRLRPGEVLVCAMTSPPWTPLFAIAAAVVADTGSTLSHSSIAAREYGIPAVVGTRTATRTVPDGALITVDGTNGVVRLEE